MSKLFFQQLAKVKEKADDKKRLTIRDKEVEANKQHPAMVEEQISHSRHSQRKQPEPVPLQQVRLVSVWLIP